MYVSILSAIRFLSGIFEKNDVHCLSGWTRTRQSCPDFRCPCPPTAALYFKYLYRHCSNYLVLNFWAKIVILIVLILYFSCFGCNHSMHNLVFDCCHVRLQIIFQSHSSSTDSTLFFRSTRKWFY